MAEIYLLVALISVPILTFVKYRHARYKSQILSWRVDLGFAVMQGLIASVIWPLGWVMVICDTGFCEGVFSEKAKR